MQMSDYLGHFDPRESENRKLKHLIKAPKRSSNMFFTFTLSSQIKHLDSPIENRNEVICSNGQLIAVLDQGETTIDFLSVAVVGTILTFQWDLQGVATGLTISHNHFFLKKGTPPNPKSVYF